MIALGIGFALAVSGGYISVRDTERAFGECWYGDGPEPRAEELVYHTPDGDLVLASSKVGEKSSTLSAPENRICAFQNVVADATGEFIYFVTPSGATSGAVHQIDLSTGIERFIIAGNEVAIIGCGRKYAELTGRILVAGTKIGNNGRVGAEWIVDPVSGKSKELTDQAEIDDLASNCQLTLGRDIKEPKRR